MLHHVVRIEDVSYAKVKRYHYRVAVDGQPTEVQVREMLEGIIARAKADKDRPFSALGFSLYRKGAEVDGPYTIAAADYAPGGDWGQAGRPGRYRGMKLSVRMR